MTNEMLIAIYRLSQLYMLYIKHWADGGETSVSNGVCLCQYHHTLVHEGGYTIERVSDNELRMNEQFEQQRHTNNTNLFEFEKDLRNNTNSFDTMRSLSPTRYRFRVKNAQGVDVRASADVRSSTGVCFAAEPHCADTLDASSSPPSYQAQNSTRVECSEPECGSYNFSNSIPSLYSHANSIHARI